IRSTPASLHRRQFSAAPLAVPLGRIVERAALLTLERLHLFCILCRWCRAQGRRLGSGLRPDLSAARALTSTGRGRTIATHSCSAAYRHALSARPRVRHGLEELEVVESTASTCRRRAAGRLRRRRGHLVESGIPFVLLPRCRGGDGAGGRTGNGCGRWRVRGGCSV